jgi:hypothetical protein
MEKIAYDLGAELALNHVKTARFFSPATLGMAGLSAGGVYGLMGRPGDPYAEYNKPGFLRGATLFGARGLGAGLGLKAAKGMGVHPLLGAAGGLLLGNVFGRGLVGPDRPEVTGPVQALRA